MMNVPTTRLHQQPLLFEPAKAAALDKLSKQLGMPKQELLREAVDDLLAMHNMGVKTLTVEILKGALRQSADLVSKLEELMRNQATWKRKCYEAKQAINDALEEVGVKNLL
jgi:predicted DNA-binding protein